MIRDITPLQAIDWDSPGRRIYSAPFTSDGAWGRIRIPLAIFARRDRARPSSPSVVPTATSTKGRWR